VFLLFKLNNRLINKIIITYFKLNICFFDYDLDNLEIRILGQKAEDSGGLQSQREEVKVQNIENPSINYKL
jgi:hypothetical protein